MKKFLLLPLFATYCNASKPVQINIGLFGGGIINKKFSPIVGGAILTSTNFNSPVQIFAMVTSSALFIDNKFGWAPINVSYGIKGQVNKDLALHVGIYHHTVHLFKTWIDNLLNNKEKFGAQAIIEYKISDINFFAGYGYIPFASTSAHEVMIGVSKKVY